MKIQQHLSSAKRNRISAALLFFAFGALSMQAAENGPVAADVTPPQPGQLAEPAAAQSNSNQPNNAPGTMNLPNTVSAPPFTVADKFSYRVVQSFGLRGFLGATVSATIGQASGSPREWGGGVQGYAERFGSAFGGNLSRQTFAFVLESALREDPRYFASQEKNNRVRFLNAVKQVFVCKTDSGHSSFAYARVVSAFGNGQFVNVWQPPSNSDVAHGIQRGFISLGGDFAYNMLQEFFPFTRPISLRHRH